MADLRGVLLAGGTGSRLMPLTKVTNKHLLPIGKKPMIEWSLGSLIECSIKDIMVITGSEHAGAIFQYLGSGKQWGVNLTYRVQDTAGGIAQAISLASDFAENHPIMVMLGDNIFGKQLCVQAAYYVHEMYSQGALVVVSQSDHPQDFGVVEIKDRKIVGIEEKPAVPKSNMVQTGCYFYDTTVFETISKLKPSARGELEVADLNLMYMYSGMLNWVETTGWWTDAGTLESYAKANEYARG